jgi:hypothetical protein
MADTKKTWEELYAEAIAAVAAARTAIDNIAGWSGSAGNWPLQDACVRINTAHDALTEKPSSAEES